MKIKKKVLVFTATYNEKANIRRLIANIKKNLSNCWILIIDDNSPDKTMNVIKNLQKKIKKIDLIIRNKKLGLDTAHKLAYEYAVNKNFDYLITMDADLSHDPKELINFIKNLKKNHFVVGSRYMKGGKCLMKGGRLLISRLGNQIIRFFSGIACSEFTTSYRGFNIKKLKNFHLSDVKEHGYSFFMGTIFGIYQRKFLIKEIPITFYDRAEGVSKIPKFEIFRTLKNLLFFLITRLVKINKIMK